MKQMSTEDRLERKKYSGGGGGSELDCQMMSRFLEHSDQVHAEEKPKYEGLQFLFLDNPRRRNSEIRSIIPWFHVVELTARKQQMMRLIISNFALQILLKFYYLCFAFKNLYP